MSTTMRIAYHPSGSSLSTFALNAWIAAALADITASPGVVVNVQRPNYPYPFKPNTNADDRMTRGGRGFSRIQYTARAGSWKFSSVPNAQIAIWDAWYAATQGFRVPFVVELPLSGGNAAVRAPGPYPLVLDKPLLWSGSLNVQEYLP